MKLQAILFDLDGTLLDTAPDLAWALNTLLLEEQRQPLPFAVIREQVSNGGNALIELGFGLTPSDEEQPRLRQRLLDIYAQNIANHTCLFPGMEELLATLERHRIGWGVVTNKPKPYTEQLLARVQLAQRSGATLSPEDLGVRKPDPTPLLHACKLLNSQPAQTLYIGDHERDIVAGKRAGMPTMAALYGYISATERPADWQADYYVNSAAEITEWVMQRVG